MELKGQAVIFTCMLCFFPRHIQCIPALPIYSREGKDGQQGLFGVCNTGPSGLNGYDGHNGLPGMPSTAGVPAPQGPAGVNAWDRQRRDHLVRDQQDEMAVVEEGIVHQEQMDYQLQ